jgi:hypothetical protein
MFLYHFDPLINIFLNKNYFKKQFQSDSQTSPNNI